MEQCRAAGRACWHVAERCPPWCKAPQPTILFPFSYGKKEEGIHGVRTSGRGRGRPWPFFAVTRSGEIGGSHGVLEVPGHVGRPIELEGTESARTSGAGAVAAASRERIAREGTKRHPEAGASVAARASCSCPAASAAARSFIGFCRRAAWLTSTL